MTKSDHTRKFLEQNKGIEKSKPRFAIAKMLCEQYPDIYQTPKRADAILQNVYKTNKIAVITPGVNLPKTIKPTNGSLTEEQIRSMFDVRQIVITELNKIQPGEYWKDSDFTRRFQGKSGFRGVLESPESLPFRGKASGQVFWGHPKSIEKLKNEGVLL
jgi:hypothetical protein